MSTQLTTPRPLVVAAFGIAATIAAVLAFAATFAWGIAIVTDAPLHTRYDLVVWAIGLGSLGELLLRASKRLAGEFGRRCTRCGRIHR